MPMLHAHAALLPCKITTLNRKIKKENGEVLEMTPDAIFTGDCAIVTIRPQGQIQLQPFDKCPGLGRICLRFQDKIIAVGKVTEVEFIKPRSP